MKRYFALAYGVACYAVFFFTFLYAVGFLGNFGVPKSIDSEPAGPIGMALAINGLLLVMFAIQHSVMARPAFKRWWAQFVPQHLERSTYVLFSTAALGLLFWQWRTIDGVVWHFDNQLAYTILYGLYAAGWVTVFFSTCLINHFDLFGLRQVWHFFNGQVCKPLAFRTPGPYRLVRHPLYVSWLLASWATPSMSIAHLVFAVGVTAYILIAIQWEERDLITYHGEQYRRYQQRVPMLIPRVLAPRSEPTGTEATIA